MLFYYCLRERPATIEKAASRRKGLDAPNTARPDVPLEVLPVSADTLPGLQTETNQHDATPT
jgi:hypothetical protein